MPESIPWLIANHKLEKAESIVRRVFKTYHARLPASLSVRRQVRQTSGQSNLAKAASSCLFHRAGNGDLMEELVSWAQESPPERERQSIQPFLHSPHI